MCSTFAQGQMHYNLCYLPLCPWVPGHTVVNTCGCVVSWQWHSSTQQMVDSKRAVGCARVSNPWSRRHTQRSTNHTIWCYIGAPQIKFDNPKSRQRHSNIIGLAFLNCITQIKEPDAASSMSSLLPMIARIIAEGDWLTDFSLWCVWRAAVLDGVFFVWNISLAMRHLGPPYSSEYIWVEHPLVAMDWNKMLCCEMHDCVPRLLFYRLSLWNSGLVSHHYLMQQCKSSDWL